MTRRNADRPIREVQDFTPEPPRRWRLWPFVVAVTLFGAAVAAVAWGDEPATCGMPMENLE